MLCDCTFAAFVCFMFVVLDLKSVCIIPPPMDGSLYGMYVRDT